MSIVQGYCKAVTGLNRWLAVLASLLVFIMVAVISYEVVARYFFDAPTVWALELSTLLLGPYFMLAGLIFCTQPDTSMSILFMANCLQGQLPSWIRASTPSSG